MADVTPYIIVDNQKLSPVGWSPRSGSATDERSGSDGQTFGVIDRVTISEEAREKFRSHGVFAGTDLPPADDLSNQSPAATRPLLAYSPKQPR